jgi:hypothetical protein
LASPLGGRNTMCDIFVLKRRPTSTTCSCSAIASPLLPSSVPRTRSHQRPTRDMARARRRRRSKSFTSTSEKLSASTRSRSTRSIMQPESASASSSRWNSATVGAASDAYTGLALMRRLFAAPRICEMTANPPTTAAQVSPIFSLVPAGPFNKSFMVLSDMTGSLEERGASSISGLR